MLTAWLMRGQARRSTPMTSGIWVMKKTHRKSCGTNCTSGKGGGAAGAKTSQRAAIKVLTLGM